MKIRYVFFLLLCTMLFVWSCNEDDGNALRKDYISVYLSKESKEPLTAISVPCAGGDVDLYVKSTDEFSAFWQDSYSSPWGRVRGIDKDGVWSVLHLHFRAISTTANYTRRSGSLTLNVPEKYLGTFITVHQGITARLSDDFSWLKYGSADPFSTSGEYQFQKWAGNTQSWTSTLYDDKEQQAVFGKYGWFYIGDENGSEADIVTPYVNSLIADSLLMISFQAVAYTAKSGTKDVGKLTVEILGGGVFQDFAGENVTTMDIKLNHFSVEDLETVSSTMWNAAETCYNMFVISSEDNPVTGETRIRFLAPSGNGQANRVALDNIYIRKYEINGKTRDEDMFKANGGSGLDRITLNSEEVE